MKNSRPAQVGCRSWGALFILILIPFITFSGCAVSPAGKRIAAFSSATLAATSNTTAAFETVEQSYHQTQVAALVIDYDSKGFNPKSIQPFLPPEDLEVRARVLGGLQEYASKLSEIMSDKHIEEFDAQTKALGQSLVDLKGNPALKRIADRVPSTDLNILTTAIDTLGRWFINYKRQKNVPKIVGEMQKPVQEICTLFSADIGRPPDPSGANGRGLRDQLWRQYDQLLVLQAAFIDKNKDKLDPKTKAEEIARLPALVAEQQRADDTLKMTQTTLDTLAQTHEQLVHAFDKNTPRLDQLVVELYSEAQRVKTFYESLAKK